MEDKYRDALIDSYCGLAIILNNEYTGVLKYDVVTNKYALISFEEPGKIKYFLKSKITSIRTVNEPEEWNIFSKLKNRKCVGLKNLKERFR